MTARTPRHAGSRVYLRANVTITSATTGRVQFGVKFNF